MRYLSVLFLLFLQLGLNAQYAPPRVYENNQTLTYQELITAYQALAKTSPRYKLLEYGKTDAGHPLHLLVISNYKEFDPKVLRNDNMRIVLINNGIHPGEPAGIEASLQFAAELGNPKSEYNTYLKNTVVCIIPSYNIGGMLNRSPYHRAQQDEPEACGFRGNARNIDLNRDFMALRSENAQAFTDIFHEWKPDVFLDTHTTDGSDHQYTITLVTTAHQDLPPALGTYLDKTMRPALYKMMEEKSVYLMCPYVTVWNNIPDNGFEQLMESPRYSTGYASLFNTLAFMTENHIFKPFEDRVKSTLDFMYCLLEFTSNNAEDIKKYREQATEQLKKQDSFVLQWKLDSSSYENLMFRGYEASYPPSKLTGEPLLFYDQNKPFTKAVKYYNHWAPELSVDAPKYYIIPQAWKEAIKRLDWNKVELLRLTEDVSLDLEMYYIDDFKTTNTPYNGHYLHYDVKVSSKTMKVDFYKGDYLVPVKGRETAYIIQALEPQAPDSYFAWNMFDDILQSREYFSVFAFEDRAMHILDTTPGLREKLKQEIARNPKMAKNTYLQMQFIYRNSPYFEVTYKRYPVGRINKKMELKAVDEKLYK
ncbi:MAG: M14 family zinc carboxypeptidase [Salinivirgaceae bacterium]